MCTQSHLLQLLLWPQLVSVPALLLAAVGCSRVQPSIAPAAIPGSVSDQTLASTSESNS